MQYIKLPLNNIISIKKIVTVFRRKYAANFKFDGESHDFWEIVYVERGSTERTCGDKIFTLGEGDLIFHKPGEFHSMQCDGINSTNLFIISFDCHSSAMSYFNERCLKVPGELTPYLREIIDEATKSYIIGTNPLIPKGDAPIGSQQMLRCSLEAFLIRLLRLAESDDDHATFVTTSAELGDSLTAAVIDYLSKRIYENINLDRLSADLHYSKSRICHVFKEKTGTTVKQYSLKIKIIEAQKLLKSNSLSISEISDMLCFDSPNHFSKTFKKHIKESPTEYRRRYVKR